MNPSTSIAVENENTGASRERKLGTAVCLYHAKQDSVGVARERLDQEMKKLAIQTDATAPQSLSPARYFDNDSSINWQCVYCEHKVVPAQNSVTTAPLEVPPAEHADTGNRRKLSADRVLHKARGHAGK